MATQTTIQKANNPSTNKAFYAWFISMGYAMPGAQISTAQIRRQLKISIPRCMKPIDCQLLSLKMLGPIGYTRDKLLHKGLYFGQKNGNFRVKSLKNTSKAILAYAVKACNATIRGQTLNNNLAGKYNTHKTNNDKAFTKAITQLSKVKS